MRPLSLIAVCLLAASCQLTFNPDLIYACATEADCGGGGYRCLAGTCCRASGPELCGDGKDNDCDGRVDGDGARESCNGLDDDCDGETDEGFDLQHEPANCGACGKPCDDVSEFCNEGTCELRPEVDCNNGLDEDQDGTTDCGDPTCNLLSCGESCICKELRKTEVNCMDGADTDGDGALDCGDSDCALQSCGEGCTCIESVRHETTCSDRDDNDQDGEIDCADFNCAGQLCLEGTTWRCSGGVCSCNGGPVESEDGVSCGDGVDNDCDGLTDCAEPSCESRSCSADGHPSCLCVEGKKVERECDNLADDDGDGLTDCADTVDCPERSACTGVLQLSTRAGQCNASGQCVAEFCFDGADNDGDALSDCGDPDCSGSSCGADCLCVNGSRTELNCSDGLDNDGDGLKDCGDEFDCPAGTACIRLSNGAPGVCQAASKACN